MLLYRRSLQSWLAISSCIVISTATAVAHGQISLGPSGIQVGPTRSNYGGLPAPYYGRQFNPVQQGIAAGAQGLIEGRSVNQSVQQGFQAGVAAGVNPNGRYYQTNGGYYQNGTYYPNAQAGVTLNRNGVAVQTYVPGQLYRTADGAYWRANAQGQMMPVHIQGGAYQSIPYLVQPYSVARPAIPHTNMQGSANIQSYASAPLSPSRPSLGVKLKVDGSQGVRITEVMPNSPAQAIGLQGGDSIVAINGQATTDIPSVVNTIGTWKSNVPLPMTILRNGETFQLSANLVAYQQVFK